MGWVVNFEVQAEKPERAAKFYKQVFGWSIEKWAGSDMEYWVVMNGEKDSKEPGLMAAC